MKRELLLAFSAALAGCGFVFGADFDGKSRDPNAPPAGADGTSGGSQNPPGASSGGSSGSGGPPGPNGAPCSPDLTKDAKNCGECGHSCLGSTCTSGLCDPTAISAKNIYNPGIVVVSGSKAYFSTLGQDIGHPEDKTIREVGIDGTGERTLEQAENVQTILATPTSVFWMTWNDVDGGKIRSCSRTGACSATTISPNAGPDSGLVLIGSNLYFNFSNEVSRCASTGCASPTKLSMTADQARSSAMVTDGTRLYWIESSGIRTCVASSCAPSTLYAGAATALAIVGSQLVWGDSAIWVAPTSGGVTPTKLADVPGGTAALAVDATNAYYTGGNGEIGSCALTGCGSKPKILAKGQESPTGAAVDATHVYWLAGPFDQGALYKVAK
jgi:hypothetical protein